MAVLDAKTVNLTNNTFLFFAFFSQRSCGIGFFLKLDVLQINNS